MPASPEGHMLELGLALFIGIHVLPGLPGVRAAGRARLGEGPWKGLISLGAIVGLGLIVWGWSSASTAAVGAPAPWTRHAAWVLVPSAFVMISSGYVPSRIGWYLGHPMSLSVAVWAAAHLAANHEWRSAVLFGSLCAWGIASWFLAALRDGFRPKPWPDHPRDLQVIVVGLALGGVMMLAHGWLFGVAVVP